MHVVAENRLDAILYPHQQRLVVPIDEEQVERDGVLSMAPAFLRSPSPQASRAPPDAPISVPVGVGLLGAGGASQF